MAMPKATRTILIVAVVAAAAWAAWYLYRKHQEQESQSPTGSLGTNLNSVAPELIGGSTGPSVGPALSAPINITLNETVGNNPEDIGSQMYGSNMRVPSALARQGQASGAASGQDVAPSVNSGAGDQTGTTGAPGLGEGGGTPSNPGGINKPTSGVNPGGPIKRTTKPKRRVVGTRPMKKAPPTKRKAVKRA